MHCLQYGNELKSDPNIHACIYLRKQNTCPKSITLSDADLWLQRTITSSPLPHPATHFCYFQSPRPEFDLLLWCWDQREHVCPRLGMSADLLQSTVHHGERLLRSSVACSAVGRKDEDASDLWPPVSNCLLEEHCANLYGMRHKRHSYHILDTALICIMQSTSSKPGTILIIKKIKFPPLFYFLCKARVDVSPCSN